MPYGPVEIPPELPEQPETWNMATEFMRKISNVLDNIIEIMQNPYKNGQARYKELQNNIRILDILVAPYLDETEAQEVKDKFMNPIITQPIVETGFGQIIPLDTEDKLYEFPKWVLCKLKAKGALVPSAYDLDREGL
jgi:hypothetical protein